MSNRRALVVAQLIPGLQQLLLGKLAITTREEYVASLQPHIRSDKVITLEEKNEREKILNGHCIRLTRILCVGESHRHEPRVRQAVTNKFCPVPVLSGLLKD